MGATKTRRVFVRVTDGQHANMRAKAEEYGVSLSRLVLVAVEAYARTYDEWPGEGQAVAVSYGVWTTVDDKLQGIEEALRDVGRQLGGVRRALRDASSYGFAAMADPFRPSSSSLVLARRGWRFPRRAVTSNVSAPHACCEAVARGTTGGQDATASACGRISRARTHRLRRLLVQRRQALSDSPEKWQ